MKKRIVSVLIVIVMALSVFVGCSDAPGVKPVAPDVTGVVFADRSVVYNGQAQSVTCENLPTGVKVVYENNVHTDAGTYNAKAEIYAKGGGLLKTLDATLTVRQKSATVVIDNKTSVIGDAKEELTYTADGVLEGDDLGVTLTVDISAVGTKQIQGSYKNNNYDVTFTGGTYSVEPPDVSSVVFVDKSAVYDGQRHELSASGIPEGISVEYENNAHTGAGTYYVTAKLYKGTYLVETRNAFLTVAKKQATVTIDDKSSMVGTTEELTYTTDGVLAGDDLGVKLSVKTSTSGIKQIKGTASNENYDVTFVGGTYTVSEEFMNNLTLETTDDFLPNYAPFALQNAIFTESVITSISFIYSKLVSGYTADSQGLYMPVYVVKKDFTTKQSECTVENGKKILLDFTGKLAGVKSGDVITADGLHIEIGADETLAFGDAAMTVLPRYTKRDRSYPFHGKIFESKQSWNDRSLMFGIVGYSTKNVPDDDRTFISFLGDSISTYAGYSNSTAYNDTIGGNAIWFPNNNYSGADLIVQDTWWHSSAARLGYTLCVNNSWSGSVVNTAQTYNVRAKNLHNKNGNRPDVIVIFMGVNDYAANTAVGTYDGTTAVPTAPSDFSSAYGKTVATIKSAYPAAKVFCCTFLPDRKRFSGGTNGNGINETAYNDAIRAIAENTGCYLVDLYADCGINESNIGSYTVDRLHPNSAGMTKIADVVVSSVQAVCGDSVAA